MRRGIILAGGKGTRLFPVTKVLSKQLLPVYDKPMIYYPLSTLMLGGIKEILLISSPESLSLYQDLLGDGSNLGININYAKQISPDGLAQAFLIGANFIGGSPVTLILGDNIFYGDSLGKILKNAYHNTKSTIFAYHVNDPSRYGVVGFDKFKNITSLEEKPLKPKSSYAITGLYYYDENVVEMAKTLKPSNRGELEITDLNSMYLKDKKLDVEFFGRGYAWLDTGTHDSLLDASLFVSTIQSRQGYLIGCPEEVSFQNGWINEDQLKKIAINYNDSFYKKYLEQLILS